MTPTITTNDRGRIRRHPAFGSITLTTVSSSREDVLNGSDVRHSQCITLRINSADSVESESGTEFMHAGQNQIEVDLTALQLGQLLSSMNRGDGVACTIRSIAGERLPRISAVRDVAGTVDANQVASFNKLKADIKAASERIETEAGLSKTKRAELTRMLGNIAERITGSAAYYQEQLTRHVEASIADAKADIAMFSKVNGVAAPTLPYTLTTTHTEQLDDLDATPAAR
jgi:hypothetical protein